MLKKSKTMNFNGSSAITAGGREETIMTMDARLSENGSLNLSKYVQDKALYLANKEEVDADYLEFEEYVNSFLEV